MPSATSQQAGKQVVFAFALSAMVQHIIAVPTSQSSHGTAHHCYSHQTKQLNAQPLRPCATLQSLCSQDVGSRHWRGHPFCECKLLQGRVCLVFACKLLRGACVYFVCARCEGACSSAAACAQSPERPVMGLLVEFCDRTLRPIPCTKSLQAAVSTWVSLSCILPGNMLHTLACFEMFGCKHVHSQACIY